MEIDLGMAFLYFTAFCFWVLVITVNVRAAWRAHQQKKNRSRAFDGLVKNLSEFSERLKQRAEEEKVKTNPEAVEEQIFKWRHGGKMNEVKIIIDPNLNGALPGTLEEFQALVKSGHAGKLQDAMNGVVGENAKAVIATRDEFRFSSHTVAQLKLAGLTPDEVVAKLLKAAGRMD